jgi:hypothetical protein
MKPYWFIEDPVDTEHKYYILMAKLKKIKASFGKKEFEKKFNDLLVIQRDLKSFSKNMDISQRSLIGMTEREKNNYHNLLDKNSEEIDEIFNIVKNSLEIIKNFIGENPELEKKYNSAIEIEIHCPNYSLWDQGFLVIKKESGENMRIFNWFFSMITLEKKDAVALLMTELLDPLCENTNDLKTIKNFLKNNVKSYAERSDCILVAKLENNIDLEYGTEIGKERCIEIILDNFRRI